MNATHAQPVGIVFDIQRSAMHDGPGIRTTVFLKGCPLRCFWCHNPESQALPPQTGLGGKIYGRAMSVEAVMAVVRRDIAFYRASGGGLTISGGEPTFQADFCVALLRAAKAEGLHTCLDTSGCFSAAMRERVRPLTDLFLFDWKATGADRHRALTGVSEEPIRANLESLLEAGAAVWLRCPLVPTVNDQPEHLRAIAELSRRYPALGRVDILPYHRTGAGKWRDLGLEPISDSIPEPDDATRRHWAAQLAEAGARGVCCESA
jgi:pyruvate formate lyase activating enzyme